MTRLVWYVVHSAAGTAGGGMGVPRIVKLLGLASVSLFVYANFGGLHGEASLLAPAAWPARDSFGAPRAAAAAPRTAAAAPHATAVAEPPTTQDAPPAGRGASAPAAGSGGVQQPKLILRQSTIAESKRVGTLPPQCTPRADEERQKLLDHVPTPEGVPSCEAGAPICDALRLVVDPRAPRVLVTAVVAGQEALLANFLEASGALRLPTVVLTLAPEGVAPQFEVADAAATVINVAEGGELRGKWESIREILSAGRVQRDVTRRDEMCRGVTRCAEA